MISTRIRPVTASLRYLTAASSSSSFSLPPSSPEASTSGPPTPNASGHTHHLITLVRSSIGLPSYASRTLEALGLHKRFRTVLHPFGPATAGQILRVKELVQVRNVTKEEGEEWLKRTSSKGEGNGVQPVGRVFGGGKGAMSW